MDTATVVTTGVLLLMLSIGALTATTAVVDIDGDETPIIVELQAESEPFEEDTDGDGIGDGVERRTYGTDPAAVDTDGDGLDDHREISDSETDPTKNDTDGDGLSDRREVTGRTDPLDSDTDGDGILDGSERNKYGTDPTAEDTDDDGFTDWEEITLDETLPDANPTRVDIFVEVDYMTSPGLTEAEISKLEETFANAPVRNPDGSAGISLHIRMDENVPTESPVALSADTRWETDIEEYANSYFDHRNQGYQYALIAEEVRLHDESVGGAAYVGDASFLVHQYSWKEHVTGSTFMHELGHSLGVSHHPDGPRTHSFESYPSVMNYNKPNDYYGYSSGDRSPDAVDEWARLLDNRPDSVPETSDLPSPEQDR